MRASRPPLDGRVQFWSYRFAAKDDGAEEPRPAGASSPAAALLASPSSSASPFQTAAAAARQRARLVVQLVAPDEPDRDKPAAVASICVAGSQRRLLFGDRLGRVYSWSVPDAAGGAADYWVRDDSVTHCTGCGVRFTFSERRHHCRCCGRIFCARCTAIECSLPQLGILRPVRVCQKCYTRQISGGDRG